MDWTHKRIKIGDIRKLRGLYVISISPSKYNRAEEEIINSSLMIDEKIFDERTKSYFLKEVPKISREDILGVEWNMYITKGYFVKIDPEDDKKFNMTYKDPEKHYVSFLEISGILGDFNSLFTKK